MTCDRSWRPAAPAGAEGAAEKLEERKKREEDGGAEGATGRRPSGEFDSGNAASEDAAGGAPEKAGSQQAAAEHGEHSVPQPAYGGWEPWASAHAETRQHLHG